MERASAKLSRVVFSSGKSDWRTPKELFERLDRQWGPFALDAAASADNALCASFYDAEVDALKQDWSEHERVFVNPPYGRTVLDRWVNKAVEESVKGARVVMLLPARTDSAWYHDLVKLCAFHVEFIRGRVRFSGSKAGAPFPSMVVVFEASSW